MAPSSRGRGGRRGCGRGQSIGLREDLRRLQAEILEGLDSEEDSPRDSGPAAPLGDLTEEGVLAAAGEGGERIEEVSQLVLRERNLRSLMTPGSVDFAQLVSLEVLSLSHNLLEDIGPLSVLSSLVEVNLNFNNISDLSPLYECELLEKLFASHNCVASVAGLDVGCPRLRELSLFANRLTDAQELLTMLRGLPELRVLDVGQNECSASPAQRYTLLQELPSLERLDGKGLSVLDQRLASAFFAGQGDDASQVSRPVTAPSVCARPRPPLPPTAASGVAQLVGPLPGQKLRSSRANRIDDMLVRSREPSPEVMDGSTIPVLNPQEIDLRDPQAALRVLTAHSQALRRRLGTLQMERDSLRFQIRCLRQDGQEAQPDHIREQVARLETENRNLVAVEDEREQLQARLGVVERELGAIDAPHDAWGPPSIVADPDILAQLRWENRLLEKRYYRMKRYNEQVRHGLLSARLKTCEGLGNGKVSSYSAAFNTTAAVGALAKQPRAEEAGAEAVDIELEELIAENESRLGKLRGELRETITASGRREKLQPPPRVGGAGASVKQAPRPRGGGKGATETGSVDVLTIDGGGLGRDVEWHGKL